MITKLGGDNWGYFSYVEDGELVIGWSDPHEGGELYRGKYMGDDTPHMLSLKKSDQKQYNNIVKYFNKHKEDITNTNKQIGNEVIRNEKYHNYRCPRCNKVVGLSDHYCSQCGQKLDWRRSYADIKSKFT